MKRTASILSITIALILCGSIAGSQDASAQAQQDPDTLPARVFSINNIIDRSDVYNDIVNPLRNTLPRKDTISVVSSPGHNAVFVRGTPDDLVIAQNIINELDRPKKNYRLTYTVTEMDGDKPVGTQHYAMIMTSGQETSLKLGSKVPLATGSFGAGGAAGVQTQFTYIDVGMNFDATLTEMGENVVLKSSVTDSSVALEKSTIEGVQEPIVRQATLKGESVLAAGKPLMLGSVDIPGSTNHLDIEVVMQPLP